MASTLLISAATDAAMSSTCDRSEVVGATGRDSDSAAAVDGGMGSCASETKAVVALHEEDTCIASSVVVHRMKRWRYQVSGSR